jgi:hypothetical protein
MSYFSNIVCRELVEYSSIFTPEYLMTSSDIISKH